MALTLEEICRKVGGTVVVAADGATAHSCYVGDLLSDVLAHADGGCALVTVQNHLNTVAVCVHVACAVVVICHGRPVPPDMAAVAAREGVAIVVTPLSQCAAALALGGDLPPSDRRRLAPVAVRGPKPSS